MYRRHRRKAENMNSTRDQQEKEKKPNVHGQSGYITLMNKGQDNHKVLYTIKRSDKLQEVLSKYCTSKSLEQDTIRFLLDGDRVRGDQTPEQLQMEDGDMIDAMSTQIGGGVTFPYFEQEVIKSILC